VLPSLKNRTLLLVDDGLATGATMEAAVAAARAHEPARIVVAAPVGAAESCARLATLADEVVCAYVPPAFQAVGLWYERFDQTDDDEVVDLLTQAARAHTAMRAVRIEVSSAASLPGDLAIPENAIGLVIFAHGSGSSRFSPRNVFVASTLQQRGIATLLVDLLTEHEEREDRRSGQLRFDIALLTDRLVAIAGSIATDPGVAALPLGLFGASTGGGAALAAAARMPDRVRAVVSRGGRPDLAGPALRSVTAPALMIVGGADDVVIALNEHALAEMPGVTKLDIVPGASHLFEEPGALERVAELAADWFARYFTSP
jgi:putative phosphoribosyl transferase